MKGLNSMSVRDIIALTIIMGRGTRDRDTIGETVAYGFEVADEFVEQSAGLWAVAAREAKAQDLNTPRVPKKPNNHSKP